MMDALIPRLKAVGIPAAGRKCWVRLITCPTQRRYNIIRPLKRGRMPFVVFVLPLHLGQSGTCIYFIL